MFDEFLHYKFIPGISFFNIFSHFSFKGKCDALRPDLPICQSYMDAYGTGQGLGRSSRGINGKPISKGLQENYKFLRI
jgi:hypothetical protein